MKGKFFGRMLITGILGAGLLVSGLPGTGMRVYAQEEDDAAAEASVNPMSLLGKYDSADTATIVAVDTEQQLIRLFNHDRARTYTLSYDNTSMIFDASLRSLSARLLEPGTIVDLTFLKSTKHLNSMVISSEAFSMTDVSDYDLNAGVDRARILGKFYHLSAMTLVMADGERISAASILPEDTINVRGVGDEIYAITVARGHGYLSLSADNVEGISLIDGWLELGSSYIRRITPGMFATVPEGEYELRIEGEGFDFSGEVTIYRNRETVVDVSLLAQSNARIGTVTFETTPEDADVYVGGEKAMTGVPQNYAYGVHTLRVEAEGYTPFNAYLKVGRQEATIRLNLERAGAEASTEATTADTASTGATLFATDGSSGLTAATIASTYYTNDNSSGNTGTTGATDASSTASTDSASNGSAATNASYSTGGGWSNAGNQAGNAQTNTGATNTGATNQDNAANQASTQGMNPNINSSGWVDTNPGGNGGWVNTNPGSNGNSAGWVETDPNAQGGGNSGVWVETDPNAQTVSGRRITISSPQGAQVYFDGAYIGVAPTYLGKTPGLHTVTLRMQGYRPQTYTISVDDSDNNRTFNFPALIAE